MNSDQLIGGVAAAYLQDHLNDDDSLGVDRYLLDCLTAAQTAAVAKAILLDPILSKCVQIRLPISFVGEHGLPDEILTDERTTYFRNATCDKAALLVANTGDDEEQSLKELVPIGALQLQKRCDLWVKLAAEGLPITDQHKTWWLKALEGLLQVRSFALDRFSQYILQTRNAVEDGQPILSALGVALPALRIPKDTVFFSNINQKTASQASKWKALYAQAIKKRSCYLLKQTPTQALLFEDDLVASFERVKDDIPDDIHPTLLAFIRANSGWNEAADDLAQCEWEMVKPIFDGLKREKFNLGKATLEFYEEREAELLTEDELDYLERLSQRNYTESQEADEDFYEKHRNELKEKPPLKAKWDKFVYGLPIETEDFISGIALCMERLFDRDMPFSKRQLKISCDRRSKKDLKDLNEDAGLFFASRYCGLKALFGNRVSWDIGALMDFRSLSNQWRKATKRYVNRSFAKSALQLKFLLELEVELPTGATETYFKQLVWKYDPNAITSEFHKDWLRLAEHPLVFCRVNRELVSGKGRCQSLDLRNVRTLYPAYGQDRGSLVPIYKKELDISLLWPENLKQVQQDGFVSESIASQLLNLFQAFQQSYQGAIKGFVEDGLCCDSLNKQAEDYGVLLRNICLKGKGDRNREKLLRLLMEIGTVEVDGGNVTALVAPWHPLRLSAMANKALRIARLIKHLLTADEVYFGDSRLFFKELEEELSHPYYPEIVLGWHERKPELLSLSDHYLDYSLHESPVVSNDGFDDTNESPSGTSTLIVNLTKRFLSLYPHELANFSIVLYNCDSARLPYALVDKMNELQEDEEDMRCQIILRHRDGKKLRELYEQIIESSEVDADSYVSSEAAKDFMARLRIGIMAEVDQAPVPNPKDGPPADIVFLEDVITRHAGLEWYPETSMCVNSAEFIPARWSRRRPAATDDMKSVVYLCCPVQSNEGWSFITALTTFIKGDWDGIESSRLLPARKLDFNDPRTASIFQEIHNLGNWVVNFDELLDRRQLLNQNVKVIRYKQGVAQRRNILISSTAPLSLLHSMVYKRVKDLNINGLTDSECRVLVERFINDANEISGDLVLRAAKRGRNASELMGVVLSRYMIRHELGSSRHFGWYFLDDYAEWLGQREGQIADILALSPQESPDGKLQLAVIISEAKYIDQANLATKGKESQKQLRDTVRRIDNAIFGNPKRLDRDLWLSRFSDLIINGIQFPANSPIDLQAWRRAVRDGECDIHMRGYSHVFVSGPSDSPECSDFVAVTGAKESWQEVFSRARLREIVLSYTKDADPTSIRKGNAGDDIWKEQVYRKSSERIQIPQLHKPNEQSTEDAARSQSDDTQRKQLEQKILTTDQSSTFHDGPSMPPPSVNVNCAWAYPQIEKIIADHETSSHDSDDEEWLKKLENRCKGALQHFQLQSKLLSKALTPNAALLKFRGSANLTVDQVLKRRSEFLTTHGLNVISVHPQPGIVAIAIARPNRRELHLLDVWKQWDPSCLYGNYELLIGLREEDNGSLFLSPKSNAPHTLIAGSTGSGKSVLMQNIILGIACTNTPEQAKIVLIDPKLGVDYFAFDGLPHLQGGIIDNQENAMIKLNELIEEMNRRYTILKENKVSNIFDLNKKPNATERLPFLWIIHDEFAEWMMTTQYADGVSDIVGRLGVKARAAGISLVFAAQRPDANVMPMQLRANLGNRLVLRVDSEGTSQIALGEKGAERLLGKGHLAAKLQGEPSIIYAQAPLVDFDFLSQMVALLKDAS